MMIQAVDLLETIKSPSGLQIRQAMNGHLCRCGTHGRVISAIQLASKRMVAS
jgi:aerobic-type carbon monoxide dehydrogenase small subunit (CoxS/CutS family)